MLHSRRKNGGCVNTKVIVCIYSFLSLGAPKSEPVCQEYLVWAVPYAEYLTDVASTKQCFELDSIIKRKLELKDVGITSEGYAYSEQQSWNPGQLCDALCMYVYCIRMIIALCT